MVLRENLSRTRALPLITITIFENTILSSREVLLIQLSTRRRNSPNDCIFLNFKIHRNFINASSAMIVKNIIILQNYVKTITEL